MPTGTYAILDDRGVPAGHETFRCAPGPAGWRYVSEIETNVPTPHREIVDLVVDAGWRPLRLRIETGEHSLLLQSDGGRLTGHRDGRPLELDMPEGRDLDYLSPAFNAVTATRLGATADLDVWYFEPVTIEPVAVRQRYEHRGQEEVETPAGRFRATRWGFRSLGYASQLWTSGDVVVRYEGLYELEAYEPGATGPAPLA